MCHQNPEGHLTVPSHRGLMEAQPSARLYCSPSLLHGARDRAGRASAPHQGSRPCALSWLGPAAAPRMRCNHSNCLLPAGQDHGGAVPRWGSAMVLWGSAMVRWGSATVGQAACGGCAGPWQPCCASMGLRAGRTRSRDVQIRSLQPRPERPVGGKGQRNKVIYIMCLPAEPLMAGTFVLPGWLSVMGRKLQSPFVPWPYSAI